MKRLTINKKQCSLPENWHECNNGQLIAICDILNTGMEPDDTIMWCLHHFSRQPFEVLLSIETADITELKKTIQFITTPPTFVKPLLPHVMVGLTKYKACADGLTDCTFEQYFQYTEMFFGLYIDTNNTEYLYTCIASIYINGKFDAENIEKQAKHISSIDAKTVRYILFWFMSCRNYLAQQFKDVFTSVKKTKPAHDNLAFIKLLDNLNQGDVSRNEQLRRANLYEVLQRIQNSIVEHRKMKEMTAKK